MSGDAALEHVRSRAAVDRESSERLWSEAIGDSMSLDAAVELFRDSGRVTLNFHPDRVSRLGLSVAAGLLRDGSYRSQWVTGISAGSRSAIAGGERQRFERELFGGAYDSASPEGQELPVYGSFDLLFDPHGGSPRFGSSFVVLHRHVLGRTTLCIGDSHMGPRDVGTVDSPWSLLAALAGQAARGVLLDRALGRDEFLSALRGAWRPQRPSRCLDGYVEAQVHDGVSLADDVEAIVLDPSFRSTHVEDDLASASERYGFDLRWHQGSELHVDDVPDDFRGPTMPGLAERVARADGIVDARAIGIAARSVQVHAPSALGDPPDSELQQLKYLWHTVLAHGHDAVLE